MSPNSSGSPTRAATPPEISIETTTIRRTSIPLATAAVAEAPVARSSNPNRERFSTTA